MGHRVVVRLHGKRSGDYEAGPGDHRDMLPAGGAGAGGGDSGGAGGGRGQLRPDGEDHRGGPLCGK